MPATRRILLAEHDPDVREMLVTALRDSGYQVVIAESVDAAVALLNAGHHDLVLTSPWTHRPADVLASTAPLVAAAGRTPVILMTGHAVDRAAVQAAGFRDLLPKPFTLAALDTVIAGWQD